MLVSRIITFVYLIATNDLTITTVNIILPTSKQNEVSTMDESNIPQDKQQATIYLTAILKNTLDLIQKFNTDGMTLQSARGYLYNQADVIGEMLEADAV